MGNNPGIYIDEFMHFTVPISHRLNKLIRSLHQKKFRDQNGMFLAEGEKLCSELFTSDFETELVVIREYPSAESLEIAEKFSAKGIPVYSAPKNQFEQLTTIKTPEGILAVVYMKDSEIMPGKPFLALDGISNPGNVGTIIRTAEWFGIGQVILGRDSADKFNPKVVRGSMGSIFRSQVVYHHDLVEFITENFKGYELFAATLDAEDDLKTMKHKKKFGIVFGSESHGISEDLSKMIDKKFKIVGIGNNDSLNVAISVGISLYHFLG